MITLPSRIFLRLGYTILILHIKVHSNILIAVIIPSCGCTAGDSNQYSVINFSEWYTGQHPEEGELTRLWGPECKREARPPTCGRAGAEP